MHCIVNWLQVLPLSYPDMNESFCSKLLWCMYVVHTSEPVPPKRHAALYVPTTLTSVWIDWWMPPTIPMCIAPPMIHDASAEAPCML